MTTRMCRQSWKNTAARFPPLRASLTFQQAPNPSPFAVFPDHTSDRVAPGTKRKFTLHPTEPVLLPTHQVSTDCRDAGIVIGDSEVAEGRNEEEASFIHYLSNHLELLPAYLATPSTISHSTNTHSGPVMTETTFPSRLVVIPS